MRNKILAVFMCLFVLFPLSAKAISSDTITRLEKEKFTDWYFDRDANVWNYFKNGKIVKNDWVEKKYYLNENGAMTLGWKQINNSWYYFNKYSGVMKIGWFKDGSNWYYLNQDGTMAHDTIIEGYKLGSNGAWVK